MRSRKEQARSRVVAVVRRSEGPVGVNEIVEVLDGEDGVLSGLDRGEVLEAVDIAKAYGMVEESDYGLVMA